MTKLSDKQKELKKEIKTWGEKGTEEAIRLLQVVVKKANVGVCIQPKGRYCKICFKEGAKLQKEEIINLLFPDEESRYYGIKLDYEELLERIKHLEMKE